MMAANYRHIGGGENRLGRHYSRFSGFWPMASVVDQSLALRKSQNRESNRRRRVRVNGRLCDISTIAAATTVPAGTHCPVPSGLRERPGPAHTKQRGPLQTWWVA